MDDPSLNPTRPEQRVSAVVRKIIHVDMDAFFASVEQRDFPEYRGRPIVVGSPPDRRGVVAAASYEARKYGIHSAMPSHQAARLCKDLIFVRGRYAVYEAVSRQIRDIFKAYTDLVEPLSLDEAYLDVTQNKKNSPSATWVAQAIKADIFKETGLTASAGVSYNKFLAKVASDINKPDGLCLITPEQAEAFLDTLPIGKFYGIGKVTAARMNELGIHTGADLRTWTLEALAYYFGKSGLYYYEIVRGRDDREVTPERIRKSVGAECTFDRDLLDIEALHQELEPLAEDVTGWMTRHETYGRTVTLKVKYHDFRQITRSRTLPRPVTDRQALLAIARELLTLTKAGRVKIRLLGISVSSLMEGDVPVPSEPEDLPRQLRLPL